MQCLTLKENFIFSCEAFFCENTAKRHLLFVTIKAIYIFETDLKYNSSDTKKHENKKKENFLENKLKQKLKHEEIYISEIKLDSHEISYKKRIKEDPDMTYSIKLETPLAKEYIKILVLIEGWELACILKDLPSRRQKLEEQENQEEEEEGNVRTKSNVLYRVSHSTENPDCIYLFKIIDAFITNDFVFQINVAITDLQEEYPVFLQHFLKTLPLFNKMKIDLILDDIISETFPNFLVEVSSEYSLINLSLQSTNLKDNYIETILIPFLSNAPYLEVLDISQNKLTNQCLDQFINMKFGNSKKYNTHLKTFNISYNYLTSENLAKFIFNFSKKYLCVTLFDFRGNKIDNRFLNIFNPKSYEELRNSIFDKINAANGLVNVSKETIVFDLRNTYINIDKTSYRFYLKHKRDISSHIEMKNNFNDVNYYKKYLNLESLNFIFDIYFFNKESYKFSCCSLSKTKMNVDVKYFQLRQPNNYLQKVELNTPKVNWFYQHLICDDDPDKKNKIDECTEENLEDQSNNNVEVINTDIKPENAAKITVISTKNKKKSQEDIKNSPNKKEESNRSSLKNKNPQSPKKQLKKNFTSIEEVNNEISSSNSSKSSIKSSSNSNSDSESNNSESQSESQSKSEKNDKEKPKNEKHDSTSNKDLDNKKKINQINDDVIIINDTDDEDEADKSTYDNDYAKRRKTVDKAVLNQKNNLTKNNNSNNSNNINDQINNQLNKLNKDMNRISTQKNLNNSKDYELDLYRELFKFFFLLDYYFDPILNSFASKMPPKFKRDKDYLSSKNEEERYSILNKFCHENEDHGRRIKKKTSSKNLDKKEEINYFNEELKQMYYDYKNMLGYYETSRDSRNKIQKTSNDKLKAQYLLSTLFKNNLKGTRNIFTDTKRFNPNGLIEHLSYFYLYLASSHDYKIKIPFTTLNKLISRIKIESILCLKEKAHNSLGTLSKITTGLKLSVKDQVNNAFNQLTEKAKIIIRGLEKVINFDGYKKYPNISSFLFETGNFLDIFLEKADSIFLECDLVTVCKYIQYWRDNYMRNIIYNLMYEIGKNETTSKTCDMTDEFARANNEYRNYHIKNMGLPKEITIPEFAQHPDNVDYLVLSEKKEEDFRKNLKYITKYIKEDQTYFKRNLYDRINFLLCNSSKNRKNKTNCYNLHKGNIFLKIMRILFRYNNTMDFREIGKKISNVNMNNDLSKIITCDKISSLSNAKIFSYKNVSEESKKCYYNEYVDIKELTLDEFAVEERNLRIVDFPEENNLEMSEMIIRNKKKIHLLCYSESYNDPTTLLNITEDKEITEEQLIKFRDITFAFNTKCQEKLKNLDTMSNALFVVIIQNYIRYFLEIKENLKDDKKLWDYQNLECFYQIYRFANRDGFSYKKEKNELDYPFIFLYIMCFYFEFNITMIRSIKGFVYYLFSKLSHRKHCKGIIRALNNPFRYKWVMSTTEIYKKINALPFNITIYYPSIDPKFNEIFTIEETTTAGDLIQLILEKSVVLKDSKEKDFYWIYYTSNDDPENFQYLNHEQLLVELMGIEEENSLTENEVIIEDKNLYTGSNSDDSEILQKKNKNCVENYSENKTFKKMHFEVRRRIFSPMIIDGNIDYINYYERELLYNQIKNVFYTSQIVDYTWGELGEEIAITCYFEELAEKKRQAIIDKKNEMESQIQTNRKVTKLNENMDEIEAELLFSNKGKDNKFFKERDTISSNLNSYINNNERKKSFNQVENEQNSNSNNNNNNPINLNNNNNNSLNVKRGITLNNNISNNYNNFSIVNNFNQKMDAIKEEMEEDEGLELNDELNVSVSYPANLKIKRTSKDIYEKIKQNMKYLYDPKIEFFKLVKQRPLLMSNIFEVNLKQCVKSFPDIFLLCISYENVTFLYRSNCKKFFEFFYDEIVSINILDDFILLLVLNTYEDDIDQRTEFMLRIETIDNRYIMENILSYAQLYLARKTKSEFIEKGENTLDNGEKITTYIELKKNYKFMFNRCLPFRTEPNYLNSKEITEKEILKMRENMHNTKLYKDYKKELQEKAQKEKENIAAKQKGTLNIKAMTNIPRYNQFEESDSEESSESVKVVGLNVNNGNKSNRKGTNLTENSDNGIKNVSCTFVGMTMNKEKESEKEEEKESEEKEEDEETKKTKDNLSKMKLAEESLSRAIEEIDFDDDD